MHTNHKIAYALLLLIILSSNYYWSTQVDHLLIEKDLLNKEFIDCGAEVSRLRIDCGQTINL